MRDQKLKEMYKEVEGYFIENGLIDKNLIYKFQPGMWIKSTDGFEYRFDICRNCGRKYVNKRRRGVQYGVHNYWHYCTKGVCSNCTSVNKSGINAVGSIAFFDICK